MEEKTLYNIMDAIKEGVIVIDVNYKFIYANKAIETIGVFRK